jgi:hypothetical protein
MKIYSVFLFPLLLLSSSHLWAMPSPERLQQIQAIADRLDPNHLFDGIQIDYNSELDGPAVSRKSENIYEITYNPDLLKEFPKSAGTLIGYHELGHILLGHSDMDPKLKDRATVEFEADAFAAFLYRRLNLVDKDLLSFLDFTASQTQTTPPGNERADLFRKILVGPPTSPNPSLSRLPNSPSAELED